MGSWNKTCGLSNLPIHCGEPVMVFTLVQNNKIDSFCYTTPFYSPVMLPFHSVYNDYGGGENSTGIGLPLIMDAIKANLIEMELGENPYHDIAIKREEFDESKYWSAIHENRLKISGHNGDRNVQFVMFHKRVVDHILKHSSLQKFVKTGPAWGDYKYVDYKFADILAELPPVIEALMSSGKDEIIRWRPLYRLEDAALENNLAVDYLQGNGYRFSGLISIEGLIQSIVKRQADDLLTDLLIEHITAKFIDGFMMSTRKVWIPGAHEGSHGCEDEAYRVLLAAMTTVLDEDEARCRAENGEEIDEIYDETD